MFKIGDKVKVKNHPDQVTGTIIRRVYEGSVWGAPDYRFVVEFDNDKLIPPVQTYDTDHLLLVSEYKASWEKECECGANYDRHFPNIHSQFCPLRKD